MLISFASRKCKFWRKKSNLVITHQKACKETLRILQEKKKLVTLTSSLRKNGMFSWTKKQTDGTKKEKHILES